MKRIVAVIIGLALMAPALAQASSSCTSYNNPALCAATATKTTTSTSASTLPFTGLDVVLLLVGGATLLGAGLVIRTVSRRLD